MKISLLPFFLVLTIQLIAQKSQMVSGFQIHTQQTDFSFFNDQSRELGFNGIKNDMYESIFFLQWLEENMKTTLGFVAGIQGNDGSLSTSTSRYEHFGVVLGSAWNVLKSPVWFVGPELNLNVRGEQVVLGERGVVNGLANVNSAAFIKLSRLTMPLELGINTHKVFNFGKELQRQILLGLRFGYRLDTGRESWKVDQAIVVENNGIDTGGFYWALTMAMGLRN